MKRMLIGVLVSWLVAALMMYAGACLYWYYQPRIENWYQANFYKTEQKHYGN